MGVANVICVDLRETKKAVLEIVLLPADIIPQQEMFFIRNNLEDAGLIFQNKNQKKKKNPIKYKITGKFQRPLTQRSQLRLLCRNYELNLWGLGIDVDNYIEFQKLILSCN